VTDRRDPDDGWRGLQRVFRFSSSLRRVRQDVDAELAFHLEERAAELMEHDDLTRAEAAEEVERRFGNIDAYRRELGTIDRASHRKAAFREQVSTVVRELGQALRSLRRARSFSWLTMFTLALGLGASTAIFTLLDRIVIEPLPYPNANRLIRIGTRWPGIAEGEEYGVSKYMFERFQEQSKTLEGIGSYLFEVFTLPAANGLAAERVYAADVSAGVFPLLHIRPELGRLFTPGDQAPIDPTVVVLSHELWMKRFGGDPSILGRTIDLDGRMKEVIGVLPPGVRLPDMVAQLWIPLHLDLSEPPLNNHVFSAIGLVKRGTSVEQSFRELDGLTRRMTTEHPEVYDAEFLRKTGFGLLVRPLRDDIVGPAIARSLWIMFASVGVVLLIAAANVASLFLIRIDARRREIALRAALGADRGRLALHFLAESLLLAAGAAAGALVLAFLLLRVVLALAPTNLPRLHEVRFDWPSVAFCAIVALLVGVVFGLLPIVRARFVAGMLREGGRGLTGSRAQGAARRTLVISQVALSVVLLVAAGLLAKSFAQLRQVRSGLDPHGVLTMNIALRPDKYLGDAQILAFWHELSRRIGAMPGVTSTGAISFLPFTGDLECTTVFAKDSPLDSSREGQCVPTLTVAPGYFATMRIPLNGEEPGWAENESGAGTMVVSEALAARLWPGESAIGHTLAIAVQRRLTYRITGIAADVRANGLQKPPMEAAYFPIAAPAAAGPSKVLDHSGAYLSFVVRSTRDDLPSLGAAIRHAVAEMDSRVPVADVRSMDAIVAKSIAQSTFVMLLLAIAAAIALALSAIGIYGVISYSVAQRRAEIGIRMALGAKMVQVRGIVIAQSVRLVVLGAMAGILIAIAAMRVVRSLLFQVSPTDPVVLAGSATILLFVAFLASSVPARRAAAVDPAEVLRAD
jgi:putative ABC transport system permease protein